MKKLLSRTYIWLLLLFLYAPIGVLIVFSFNESRSRSTFTEFTFQWYVELVQNELILESLWNTLLVAAASACLATILGTFAAIGMSNMKRNGRMMMTNLTYLPVINPEIVTGISLMLLFVYLCAMVNYFLGDGVLELGFWSVLIAHVTFCVPYVTLNVLPKLRQMDNSVYEAAQDLGCPPLQAFMKVVMPEIMPGVVAGFLMAFTFSIDDFVVTYFTSGSSFQTLPVTIYSMTRKKVNPQINALSTIIFVVVLLILILVNVLQQREQKKKAS